MAFLDWKELKKEATIVDLHIHPSMQQQLFQRKLNVRYVINRTFHANPMNVQASFPRLRDGGYDIIFSVLHVPEKGLQKDFPIINVFRILRPDLWKKLFTAQPFDATVRIMADMEKAVGASKSRDLVKMAPNVTELNSILSGAQGQTPDRGDPRRRRRAQPGERKRQR